MSDVKRAHRKAVVNSSLELRSSPIEPWMSNYVNNGGGVDDGDIWDEGEDNNSAGGDDIDVGADNDYSDNEVDVDGFDVGADDDGGVNGHLDHEVGRLAGLLPILLLLHSRHCSKIFCFHFSLFNYFWQTMLKLSYEYPWGTLVHFQRNSVSRVTRLCAKHASTLRPAFADKCKQNMRQWRRCAAIFPTRGLIQYSRENWQVLRIQRVSVSNIGGNIANKGRHQLKKTSLFSGIARIMGGGGGGGGGVYPCPDFFLPLFLPSNSPKNSNFYPNFTGIVCFLVIIIIKITIIIIMIIIATIIIINEIFSVIRAKCCFDVQKRGPSCPKWGEGGGRI